MPTTTEHFRDRIKLLSSAMEFMKIRFPTSGIFATSTKEVWNDHVDYVLGPKVLERVVKDSEGRVVKTPSWHLVLQYEYAIRKRACEFMNEGSKATANRPMDMASAILAARECPELRHDEFIEKLSLESSRGASSSNQGAVATHGGGERYKKQKSDRYKAKAVPNKVKGTGKGAGGGPKDKNKKGKGKGVKNALATKHEGKQICFAFNNNDCKGNCNREHICQICFGKHPLKDCSAKA
jgi:hypothetical protein